MADEELTELSPLERAKRVAKDIYSRIPEAMAQYEDPMASQSPISKSYSPEGEQMVRDMALGPIADVRDIAKGIYERDPVLAGLGTVGLTGIPAKEIAKGAKAAIPKLKSLSVKAFPTKQSEYAGKIDVGPVRFDQKEGAGAVGLNRNVGYEGFVAWMTPEEFLRLNPKRAQTPHNAEKVKAFKEYIEEGGPLGSPFIDVKEHPSGLRVTGHEGRHRMEALFELYPELPVPVHVFARRKISKDLPDSLANDLVDPDVDFNLIPDERAFTDKPLSPSAVWHRPGGEVDERQPFIAYNPKESSFTKPKLTAEELKMKQEQDDMLETIRKRRIQRELEELRRDD
tara:strand:- start:75 stop:1097 length:1023 start_codon:yes stop_codon:yes gene_type:complete